MKIFKKSIILGILAMSFSFSSSSNAAFVQTSWKSLNDSKATLHEETGLEWLDLNETDGKSFSYVNERLDSLYAGWRFPTYTEVETLFLDFFYDVDINNAYDYSTRSGEFVSLFGRTAVNIYEKTNINYGLYFKDNGDLVYSGAAARSVFNVFYNKDADDIYLGGHDLFGYFLVSDGGVTLSSIENPDLNINNPNSPAAKGLSDVSSPFGLSTLLLGGIFFSRRKKNTSLPWKK